jgi:hypothetical protein
MRRATAVIGAIYLGRETVGEASFLWTAEGVDRFRAKAYRSLGVFYVIILLTFALPALSFLGEFLPIVWGMWYLLLLNTIIRVVRAERTMQNEVE